MSGPSARSPRASVRVRQWAAACVVFVIGEVALRAYWIAGGRWGYTACDRTALADPAGGCGADQVEALPFRAGWGAAGVAVALAVVAVCATRFPGRRAVVGSWAAAVLLLLVAFPLHLFFEIPAALAGRPSDWRDLGARLALVVGGVLFAGLANASGPRRGPVAPGYQPVPRWTRRWAYVAVALPVVGWAVPHGLWVLGVPLGISERELDDIRRNLSTGTGVAITVVPPLAGLLVLGLVQRWGQRFPSWVPRLQGRPVPRLLAVIPAGVVALALATYGALSATVLVRQLLTGDLAWSDLWEGWAVAATLLVFLGWGVSLGATTIGYALATGRRPAGHHREPPALSRRSRPVMAEASLPRPEIGESVNSPARDVVPAPSSRAVWAAYAVPLCVLPSAVWRLSLVSTDDAVTTWYMVFLSALSMGLALLTLGLVHRWGQRVPTWVPLLGGRPIPARPVVIVALIGGSLLVAICVYFFLNRTFHFVPRTWLGVGRDEPAHPVPGWEVLRYYAPLIVWGPLVIVVAADYRRRAALVRAPAR